MQVFRKTMENVLKQRNIKLVTIEKRRNYHAIKFFTKHLLAIEIEEKKPEILINKSVYLGLSILELSKILMY